LMQPADSLPIKMNMLFQNLKRMRDRVTVDEMPLGIRRPTHFSAIND
jgi:hypothetical protein